MVPKGKLLIIGGAEDKGNGRDRPKIRAKNKDFKHFEILGELLPPEDARDHVLEVITTASGIPVETGQRYVKSFKNAGFQNVKVMRIENQQDARDPELVERIKNADALLFSGGDQLRLVTVLGGSEIIKIIKDRYYAEEEFTIAGTSAGAMAMAGTMIYGGETNEAILKGDVKLSPGFAILGNCIIDTHFVRRGRFGRLAEAVTMNPAYLGIGLGEDTALIIENGNEAECRGSGMVIIIDGKEIKSTNLLDIAVGQPICIENLKVHILAKGSKFLLEERMFLPCDIKET